MNFALGVTGLPCSGKSFAAAMIARGEIDGEKRLLLKADDIGHEILLRPDVAARLRERFGEDTAGGADPASARRKIAARVFDDAAALEWLENLMHPLVAAETLRRAEEAGGRVVTESALLFAPAAAAMRGRCGAVLIVEAAGDVRLARAARRGWDENELRRRESRLLPLFADAGSSKQNCVRVDNSGSAGELRVGLRAALTRRNSSL